ncbi:hypothetical protein EV586_102255 [Tumebacillus sp. BK434]|uniref:hypothetical protein n=1 Tax=Tumebacillus sp. BK434 TaxID=2512169 RepID=UPI0010D08124|nr:hypothetical protein [Tumebacillus sp. BK434]TCP57810.1 hypothetical protein EV586_102255 [Tumebacillus sp. BK434]
MKKTCRVCKGSGKITVNIPMHMTVFCALCNGTGTVTLPDHIVKKLKARREKFQKGEQ